MLRTRRTRGPFRHGLLGLAWATGCVLSVPEYDPCTSDEACRRSFGAGSVCQPSGRCSSPTLPSRCSRAYPPDFVRNPEAYADRVVIGSLSSFTDHEDTLQAAELAVRRAEALGGLGETSFAILHCDYTPQAGDRLDDIEAVESLVPFLVDELGVPAIVGPRGSGRTEAAFRALGTRSAVIISPSATSLALTRLEPAPSDEAPGRLWRTVPPDSLQSEVITRDIISRAHGHAAVLFQTGPYGESLTTLFAAQFSQAGNQVALYPFEPGQDFSVSVAEVGEGIAQGRFDEVLFVSSDIGDYARFFVAATATPALEAQFSALGEDGTEGGIFLTDTAFSQDLLRETEGTARRLFAKVRGTRPAPAEGVVFNSFAALYNTTFEADSTGSAFTPHSYDAAWLALYGIAWATLQEDRVDGLGIGRGLRRLSEGPSVDILPDRWGDVIAAFEEGRSIDVRGASGQLDYDPQTEETSAPIEIWHIVPDEGEPSGFTFARLAVVEP